MSAEGLRTRAAHPVVFVCVTAAVMLSGTAAWPADETLPGMPDSGLPIDLEAESSRFDGRARTLSFEQVRITQGTLSVRADRGSAARLDFEDSRWQFDGNVVLDNEGAHIECDHAELQFEGHALRSAVLRGDPVRLEQQRKPGGPPTRATAGLMEYDVAAATIRLSNNAWLSDGSNDVSGDRIAYDLRRQYVTAEAGDSGQVRMKIQPPPRKTEEQAQP
jgi:lipopolysaccharide export system protein LptA